MEWAGGRCLEDAEVQISGVGSMAEYPSLGECEDKGPRRRQKKTRYDKAEYHFVFLISFILPTE